jgi:hypothetical protein
MSHQIDGPKALAPGHTSTLRCLARGTDHNPISMLEALEGMSAIAKLDHTYAWEQPDPISTALPPLGIPETVTDVWPTAPPSAD